MIEQNVQQLLKELPDGVELVAAVKGRTRAEIEQAIAAGIRIVGANYVQQAEQLRGVIGPRVKWHFIGHLQKNKVNKAVKIFDLIETVDSLKLGQQINQACARENRVLPVLVEVNSGREQQKFGVFPQHAEQLIRDLSALPNIKIVGLMTMGPYAGDPQAARPYFVETKKIFNQIKQLNLTNVEMQYLSMGMSNSYRVAIEEGANIVRIGSKIFGPRDE